MSGAAFPDASPFPLTALSIESSNPIICCSIGLFIFARLKTIKLPT
jgi:hypothetical protein